MVEIGGKPILWHIMKIYSSHGINEFIICCGYKGYVIKEYFANYFLHTSDVTFHFDDNNRLEMHKLNNEPWKVTLVDTGEMTGTGGRLSKVKEYVSDGTFCFTYGDGLSDVNIKQLIDFHNTEKSMATLTAVQPPGRYGALSLDGNCVKEFQEKPEGDKMWINGGFFVLEPDVIEYITDDKVVWETDILPILSKQNQLAAFRHPGFWQPMDTVLDKSRLEKMYSSGNAPWIKW